MISGSAWDQVAERFTRRPHYLDSFLSTMKGQAHLDLISRWTGLPTSGRVLKTDLFEEATGRGMLLDHFTGRGAEVYGIDVSTAIVEQARARISADDATFVASDVRELPFDEDWFDVVISPSTLDHFVDPSDLGVSLREIARVLQPGGRLIITLDNRQNVTDFLLRFAERCNLAPYYLGRSYTKVELCDELEAAGLQVTDTAAILHNPRLFAVTAVAAAKRIPFGFATKLVQSWLMTMQRFGGTRYQYRTGSFVAALATLPEGREDDD